MKICNKVGVFAILAMSILLMSCSKSAAPVEIVGAAHSGQYHNLFSEVCGIPESEVQQRIDSLWAYFFTPGDIADYEDISSIYFEDSDSTAFIYDTGSVDVRTEGMSYGMMISLQLDKRDVFDRLWRWTKNNMAFEDPAMDGYFCWHCNVDGTQLPGHNASDGEIYYATALLMAANRWDEPSYAAEAQALIRKYQDKDPQTGIYPLFDKETKLPCFVPNEEVHWFSDPSYALPAFLQIWAERADGNNEFWAEAAQANRDFLCVSADGQTGLYPDYALMNGEPYSWPGASYDTSKFMYDAVRCTMNIGMDAHWYGTDKERQAAELRKILKFFEDNDYAFSRCSIDGKNGLSEMPEGLIAANAVGCFALLGSNDKADEKLMKNTLTRFWNLDFPHGKWRYYDGMLYMLSMLHASGQFKVW